MNHQKSEENFIAFRKKAYIYKTLHISHIAPVFNKFLIFSYEINLHIFSQ